MKTLIITLTIVNLLTLLGWIVFQRKIKSSKIEYSASNNNSDYKYEILISRPWWQKFFMDEYFTPQFKIKIKNVGADVNRGSLGCDLAEHDDVSSFPSVEKFKDFQHFEINNFKHGEIREFDAITRSKFLKPTNYMLRLKVVVWGTSGSPREELMNQLKAFPNVNVAEVMSNAEQFWSLTHIDPDKANPNQFKPIAIYDFRWSEVIKVHPTIQTLSAISTIFGISFMGIVFLVLKVIKILFFKS